VCKSASETELIFHQKLLTKYAFATWWKSIDNFWYRRQICKLKTVLKTRNIQESVKLSLWKRFNFTEALNILFSCRSFWLSVRFWAWTNSKRLLLLRSPVSSVWLSLLLPHVLRPNSVHTQCPGKRCQHVLWHNFYKFYHFAIIFSALHLKLNCECRMYSVNHLTLITISTLPRKCHINTV